MTASNPVSANNSFFKPRSFTPLLERVSNELKIHHNPNDSQSQKAMNAFLRAAATAPFIWLTSYASWVCNGSLMVIKSALWLTGIGNSDQMAKDIQGHMAYLAQDWLAGSFIVVLSLANATVPKHLQEALEKISQYIENTFVLKNDAKFDPTSGLKAFFDATRAFDLEKPLKTKSEDLVQRISRFVTAYFLLSSFLFLGAFYNTALAGSKMAMNFLANNTESKTIAGVSNDGFINQAKLCLSPIVANIILYKLFMLSSTALLFSAGAYAIAPEKVQSMVQWGEDKVKSLTMALTKAHEPEPISESEQQPEVSEEPSSINALSSVKTKVFGFLATTFIAQANGS